MNTTANIAAHLTFIANNLPVNSAYRRISIEAADRLNELYNALGDLIEDTQHVGHNCLDNYCPVMKARKVYCLGAEQWN